MYHIVLPARNLPLTLPACLPAWLLPSHLQAKINSRGFGILDIKFVNDKLGYACGGSGSLFKTGESLLCSLIKTWQVGLQT